MKLKPYLRASTKKEDQKPERQLELVKEWAARQTPPVELAAPAVDKGKSALKTNPFERPVFVQGCRDAVVEKCDGLVGEKQDRFCRQGWEREGWAQVELEDKFGLRFYSVELTLQQHNDAGGRFIRAVQSEATGQKSKEHGPRVASGIRLRKKLKAEAGEAWKWGRPAKDVTPAEETEMRRLAAPPRNLGYGRIAVQINQARGALTLADASERARRSISPTLVRDVLKGLRCASCGKSHPVESHRKPGGARPVA